MAIFTAIPLAVIRPSEREPYVVNDSPRSLIEVHVARAFAKQDEERRAYLDAAIAREKQTYRLAGAAVKESSINSKAAKDARKAA